MTDTDEAIARLIATPDEPPLWLLSAVEKARATLAWTIKKEREYPNRKEMRVRLVGLAAAIDTVREAMRDFDLATLLRAGDNFFLNENETYRGLGDLAERVSKTLEAIPTRKGPDKYFGRSEGATPQQICALMISVLWKEVRSKPPPNTNANAQEACLALWATAGGLAKRKRGRKIAGRWRIPSDGASTEVWRDHLRAAKRLVNSDEAKFLRRSLDRNWDASLKLATPMEVEIIRGLCR
jgi:hypothetical protein